MCVFDFYLSIYWVLTKFYKAIGVINNDYCTKVNKNRKLEKVKVEPDGLCFDL